MSNSPTRRHFVKTLALGAAALAPTPRSHGGTVAANERLGIGVTQFHRLELFDDLFVTGPGQHHMGIRVVHLGQDHHVAGADALKNLAIVRRQRDAALRVHLVGRTACEELQHFPTPPHRLTLVASGWNRVRNEKGRTGLLPISPPPVPQSGSTLPCVWIC
ncbi:MAG: twin-arginine translocation signal domain-containing protein, partial [Planctomycetes bacterium]|nr:twin-arginine translocation signal domain-containing protein [Planctomycetota bacterium]